MNTVPLLLCDFYKTVHSEQYPKGITKLVSYFTPRMTRIEGEDKLVMFGLQAFIKEYLIDYFNDNFFNKPKDEVISEYNRILSYTLGKNSYKDEKIKKLYDLGYLPLEIKAIPEGERVPIKVPMIEISNTHPDFAWLVNAIETLLSCSLWHTMVSANVGYNYRQIVNKYYDISVDDNIPRSKALGDFSMRGQESLESAIKSSAAFC
ncbi:MAG: nicotinamide phosphoribosyltransferase domain-containing protein, partial [Clostridiales bacterium]|nr:nicotinamide phosphoribosyltransferase domain-containing protein [Clostridiales bacterium]MDY2728801.1 nicotinamide phosphoribosyltransferase domain-containing protein [Clostridium sp.]